MNGLLVFMIALCSLVPSAVAQIIVATSPQGSLPEHRFSAVYGFAEFRFGRAICVSDGQKAPCEDAAAAYYGLQNVASTLRQAIPALRIAGSEKSTFALSLEVIRGSDVLFQAPVVTVSNSDEYVLFMRHSGSSALDITTNRTVIDYLPISDKTNKLRFRMTATALADSAFDLSVVQKLFEVGNQIKVLKTAPQTATVLPDSTNAAVKSIETILNTVFSTKEVRKVGNEVELSFIKEGAGNNSNKAVFTIHSGKVRVRERDYELDADDILIPVHINLGIQHTKLPGDSKLLNTYVNVGDEPTSVWQALRTSKDEVVRHFLDELLRNGKYISGDAGRACLALFDNLYAYLSDKDAAHYYYEVLRTYKKEIAASNEFSGCTDSDTIRERFRNQQVQLPNQGKGNLDALAPLPVAEVPRIGGDVLPQGVFPILRKGGN